MKIVVESDHMGYKLKEFVKKVLEDNNIEYMDAGVSSKDPVDYPEIAEKVAYMVLQVNMKEAYWYVERGSAWL